MGGEIGTAKKEYGWRDWDGKDGIWVERLGRRRCNMGGEIRIQRIWFESLGQQSWNTGGEIGIEKMDYGWRDWDGKYLIWVERLGRQKLNTGAWRDWDGKDGIWLEGLWYKECNVGGRAGM